MNAKVPIKDRLLGCVESTEEGKCWLWKCHISPNGYGRIQLEGTSKLAHRVSFEAFNNTEIPEGMYVCHVCDVKHCVNPAHLFLGTPTDNMQDMIRKGRKKHSLTGKCGELALRRKLSAEQVLEIRRRRSNGESQRQLAAAFGVDNSNIFLICKRVTWRHI